MILITVFIAKLSVGAKKLLEYGQINSFPHNTLVVHTQFEYLGVDILVFAKQFNGFFGFAGIAWQMLQISLKIVQFVSSQ